LFLSPAFFAKEPITPSPLEGRTDTPPFFNEKNQKKLRLLPCYSYKVHILSFKNGPLVSNLMASKLARFNAPYRYPFP
jgi:hypothetical protein